MALTEPSEQQQQQQGESRSFGERKRLARLRDVVRARVLEGRVDLLAMLAQEEEDMRAETALPEGITRHGLLPAERFLAVLGRAGVELTERDASLLVEKFGDFRGVVNVQVFYRRLDLLPPEDYADPALREDRLPQPYRMLTKILEECIVEAAWEQIKARNPTIDQTHLFDEADEDGERAEEDNDATGQKSPSQARDKRRTMATSAVLLDERRRAMIALKEKKQKVRTCARYFSSSHPDATVAFTLHSAALSVVGTADGKICVVNHERNVIQPQLAHSVFDGHPVTHLACAPTGDEDGSVLVATASSPSGCSQQQFVEQWPTTSAFPWLSQDNLSTKVAVWQLFPAYPAKEQLQPVVEAVEQEGAALQLWVDAGGRGNEPRLGMLVASLDTSDDAPAEPHGDSDAAPVLARSVVVLGLPENPARANRAPALLCRRDLEPARECGVVQVLFVCHGAEVFLYEVGTRAIITQVCCETGSSVKLWMPAGVLCHGSHATDTGVELAVFGLSDGCVVVWNVRARVVRATLRRHLCATTSVLINDLEQNGTRERTSSRSESPIQIVCGCADGKVRVFQLTSDAPAAAAILPRTFDAPGQHHEEEEETLLAALTGGIFIAELEENFEEDEPDKAPWAVRALEHVAGTPLVYGLLERAGVVGGAVAVYDLEVGAQIGRLRPAKGEDWAHAIRQLLVHHQALIVVLGGGEFRSYPLSVYVPAFFPAIARACGIAFHELDAEGDIGSAVDATLFHRHSMVMRLLEKTSPKERCDTRCELAHYLPPKQATTGLTGLLGRSPAAPARSKSPTAAFGALSFSHAGMLLNKVKANRQQAKRNVINPTRLSESLVDTLPTDRVAQFEARRVETRAEREENFADCLQRWKSATAME